MNETGASPAEAGCIAVPDDAATPVSNGLAILPALVELHRELACSLGKIDISTSGQSAAVNLVGINGSARKSFR